MPWYREEVWQHPRALVCEGLSTPSIPDMPRIWMCFTDWQGQGVTTRRPSAVMRGASVSSWPAADAPQIAILRIRLGSGDRLETEGVPVGLIRVGREKRGVRRKGEMLQRGTRDDLRRDRQHISLMREGWDLLAVRAQQHSDSRACRRGMKIGWRLRWPGGGVALEKEVEVEKETGTGTRLLSKQKG